MSTRYDNDRIYATHTWRDETSSFDPKGQWSGGDSYWRYYSARVPRRMLEKAEAASDFSTIIEWIEKNEDKEIWR